jgi:hypothetical protein
MESNHLPRVVRLTTSAAHRVIPIYGIANLNTSAALQYHLPFCFWVGFSNLILPYYLHSLSLAEHYAVAVEATADDAQLIFSVRHFRGCMHGA